MSNFGATFVPGGFDDYYMPEVVAPSPQRVTPQVPQNMQNDLQRMELEAREVDPSRRDPNIVNRHGREPSLSSVLNPTGSGAPSLPPKGYANPPADAESSDNYKPFHENSASGNHHAMRPSAAPSFSPFPKVKGDNIPPTDEEKEEILWNARDHVLHSNNVSMQLSWARDTLAWAEIVSEARSRDPESGRQTPKVEHELRTDALNIVEYLVGQEHPEALFMKAKWLEFGKFGVRPDKRDAYAKYMRAAELGYARAEYRLGMLFENSNDYGKAVEHYYSGVRLKDSAAMYRLGMMNLLGQHNHPKDYQRGLELIREAADMSDEDAPQGSYVYGMLLAKDLPDIDVPDALLPGDLPLAKMYIEKAAYLGFAKAQLKIGQAYELCQLSCDFNPAYSIHYYGLAAQQGQPEAALGVSRWFLFGYEGIFNKNEQLAFKYAQDAAKAKLPTGEFAMGYYYEIGVYVPKDLRQARYWYEAAADHGNKDALGRLEALDHSKSLTKADHESTTLTRIKSQHGSQRGKRPDRFKQPKSMPTVSESTPTTPTDAHPGYPTHSARTSPHPSPRAHPTLAPENVDYPDPSRPNSMGNRPAAFNVNLDANLAIRPKSAAPYPEDDRPAPLNLSRPKSTAPYPDDDRPARGPGPQLSPHYNTGGRPPAAPHSDRPGSAFGIRTGHGAPPPGPGGNMRPSQSMVNIPPAGADPRARPMTGGWEQPGNGYRQPSPGLGARPSPTQPYPMSGGLPSSPAPNKIVKQNPNYAKPQQSPPFQQGSYGPSDYGQPAGPGQPGRDYGHGPRTSSIPPDQYGYGRPPSAAAPPARMDSLPLSPTGNPRPQAGPGPAGGPRPYANRPDLVEHGPGRVGSAPPSSQPRPQQKPSPAPSAATMPPPKKQTTGQGPATFDEMGIPKVKDESDCVVM
ncbi:Chitin synthase regulatory factor 4 [Colletotrichum orbiculare MAFF 240422]|uniref:Chitin synthase regulatory factor 4 n=1 Tax=Colletotrichum orbiculare (strain 104-T / ATCC 96160 / CBS 514.97 / LARS 414 / MAFF 240422) TaxID=1213857 RepID=A0A484FMQ4_COLOR|nr:Chitin synthase regulatory factor 4 [Colletotrichum orbiculare MAFF 240422]